MSSVTNAIIEGLAERKAGAAKDEEGEGNDQNTEAGKGPAAEGKKAPRKRTAAAPEASTKEVKAPAAEGEKAPRKRAAAAPKASSEEE